MRKPYENKPQYDPGRFRHKLSIFETQSVRTDSGGSRASQVRVLDTYAVRESVNEMSEIVIQAGLSVAEGDQQFLIRSRTGFTPKKNMVIYSGGSKYLLVRFKTLGDPVKYCRLYCEFQENVITT